MPVFQPVPERFDFPAEENDVRRYWKENDVFQKSLERRAGAETFVFYEGPPTANGMPHPGHVLTRVMKDLFLRYKTMRGFRVPRKAGWDTHGLPVEIEVEKELGISGKEEIEKYGVEKFCRKCLESVFVYTKEWEELTERIGFWVNLDDAYVTFQQSYVESVWWSLKTLFEKDLLYQDRKVVWWWAQGGTTLSAAEVGLGYREVDDPSVFIRFRDAEDDDLSYLAWTTTPWTLPSNVGLAVSSKESYVEVSVATEEGGTERLVMAQALVDNVLGKKKSKHRIEPLSVSDPIPGAELVGRKYCQLLPWKDPEGGEPFRIVSADFVVVDPGEEHGSGTGIVHIAPAFGEDDYRVARENELGFLQLVDVKGAMTPEAGELAGTFCKSADRGIIRQLRSRGSLLREEVYRHDYPFCWRSSDDPLIQYARPAWFIGTSRFRDDLLENNRAVRWVPEHIRDGRFGKFLENNVDWALSRERYWGTPLPIWRCDATGHTEAIGSYAELLEKPGVQGLDVWEKAKAAEPDLSDHLKVHKPYIDAVTYDSPKESGARMIRVTEVIDCWYDSGAMPFAQWGYPHVEGSKEAFEESFPADFITEAIDQTRGWFYSLLAESTLVQQDQKAPHPYKTCIVLGHICDEKGKKMSKSERNYVPPNEAMDAQGADALRWYFLSQGHPWTNARFSLNRVAEAKKDFLIRLQNVYSFFVIYANIDGFDPSAGNAGATSVEDVLSVSSVGYRPVSDRNLMDRWILSDLQIATETASRALDEFEILTASRAMFDFVDRLSNWYVRSSRRRFWGEGLTEDKYDGYWTLYESLVTVSRLAAPFVPFFAESLYQNLVGSPLTELEIESVHLCDFPEARESLIDRDLTDRMGITLDLVALGRAARVDAQIRVRQPLRQATVVLADPSRAAELGEFLPLIAGELNVKEVVFASDADKYVEYILKPNFKLIGPKLGRLVQKLKPALAQADAAALRASLDANGTCSVTVDGQEIDLTPEEIEVQLEPREGYSARADRGMVLVLDTALDDGLVAEWKARELVAAVNSCRGERGLAYEARIALKVWCAEGLRHSLEENSEHIANETLSATAEFLTVADVEHTSDVPQSAKRATAGDDAFALDFEVVG